MNHSHFTVLPSSSPPSNLHQSCSSWSSVRWESTIKLNSRLPSSTWLIAADWGHEAWGMGCDSSFHGPWATTRENILPFQESYWCWESPLKWGAHTSTRTCISRVPRCRHCSTSPGHTGSMWTNKQQLGLQHLSQIPSPSPSTPTLSPSTHLFLPPICESHCMETQLILEGQSACGRKSSTPANL